MTDTAQHTTIDVTVALLTRNAGALFERVLEAVGGQETSRRVELLAVYSGSTDGTVERLNAHGARVVGIDPSNFNVGATRDLAYQQARGEIIVNLSQDAVPETNSWLDALIAPVDDPAVAASCGRSIPDAERAYAQFPWERNGLFYFTREMKAFSARYGKGLSFANSAIRRSVWETVRFDTTPLGEDFQFQIKLHDQKLGSIAFPEDACVLHHHAYTLASLWRRCVDEGRALRGLGCPYSEGDLALDLVGAKKYVQWLRELRHGRLNSAAAWLFPVVRPLAVYRGNCVDKGASTNDG
jgi:glycosyltransferase involved in cell wall biosynthesis